MPGEGELALGSTAILSTFLSGRLFALSCLLLLLLENAINLVAILEDPLALTVWLLVSEAALVEGAVGVDPLAINDVTLFPGSVELHAVGLVDVGTGALLFTELPPS